MTSDVLLLFLSKLVPLILYPLGLTFLFVGIGALLVLFSYRRLARVCFFAALVILWVCSLPVVANWVLASLERQYPIRAIAETTEVDVAIVLGGAIGQPLAPRVAPDLSEGGDRVLHAARLYRAGKVRSILVSAGNIPWTPAVKPEAELIRELLVEWGVPPAAIELGVESRNTHENAVEIKRIWRARGFKSALLVTSAAHMPRAMATFRHAGIPVVASPTDVLIVDSDRFDPFEWLPSATALGMTTNAVKEWIGYLAYRVQGYL